MEHHTHRRYDGLFRLDEAQTRAKVIELLELCNSRRMDVWVWSGVSTGTLDVDIISRAMLEELPKRSHEVQRYWKGTCNCHGQLN